MEVGRKRKWRKGARGEGKKGKGKKTGRSEGIKKG